MRIPPGRGREHSPRPWSEERGATMVEFGLLVALVAVVVASGALLLGGGIAGVFDTASSKMTGVEAAGEPGEPAPEDGTGDPAAAGVGAGNGGSNGNSGDTNGWGKGSGGGQGHND